MLMGVGGRINLCVPGCPKPSHSHTKTLTSAISTLTFFKSEGSFGVDFSLQIKILCQMIEDLVISRCDKMSTVEYENLLLRIEIHLDERHLIIQAMFNPPFKKKNT